jgi:hypothetical protein
MNSFEYKERSGVFILDENSKDTQGLGFFSKQLILGAEFVLAMIGLHVKLCVLISTNLR